jgi:hypothetical protein
MTVLDAVVFTVDGQVFTRLDVLRWAERHDAAFAARVRRRRALAALAGDDEPSETDVEAATSNFRYDRGLEDAAAMERWLDERALSVDAWWEAIRRTVLEAGPPLVAIDALRDDAVVDEEDSAGEWLADLSATDLLDAAVTDVARRAAVAREAGGAAEAPPPPGATPAPGDPIVPWGALGVSATRLAECDVRLEALAAAWERWHPGVVTEAALKTAVDHHRLEWLVVDVVISWWPGADAAHEAIWCVRDDGQPLDDVARDAHVPFESSVLLLDEAPAALHDPLLAAASGDIVGPVDAQGRVIVASVRSKRPPSLADAMVRAAAGHAVERAAAVPLLERHVAWPGSRP